MADDINVTLGEENINVTIKDTLDIDIDDTIEVNIDSAVLVESDEDITAVNVGTTANGLYKEKVLHELRFKSLAQGSGITITPGTNDITIASTGVTSHSALTGKNDEADVQHLTAAQVANIHASGSDNQVLTHDIFSATHTDVTGAASPVQGDLIVGNVTPKWSKLPIGATGKFLKSDGTDAAWSAHGLTASDVSAVPTTRTITTTSPLTIDGGASADLSANRTIAITEADPVYKAQALAANDPTGFPNRTDTSAPTFNVSSPDRTVTLAKTGASFDFYCGGVKWTKTVNQTVQIGTAANLYYIYFDSVDGVLKSSTTAWDISSSIVPVATVYWNGTAGWVGDERHGIQMDGQTHETLHEAVRTLYVTGGVLTVASNMTTHTVTGGEFYDEDFEHTPGTQTTSQIFYRTSPGSPIPWTWTTAQAPLYVTTGGAPAYDNGGTLAAVGNNKYTHTWIAWTNNPSSPLIGFVGQAEYNNQSLAEAAGPETLSIGTLPSAEILLLYRITWKSNGTTTATWSSTTDYRSQKLGSVSNYTPTDHAALSHLNWPVSGHYGTASRVASFDVSGIASETDPANWNTAYGWGNHALGGYFKADGSVAMTGNIPLYTGTGGTPAEGHMRYNATDNIPEFYDGAAWQSADCPVLIDFTTNSISDSASIQTPTIASGTVYTKMLIKWLHVTTTSTNWDLWIYTTAAGANEFQIVNDRSGNYSIYLDYPYADGSGTTNIYVKYIDNAAAAACTIRCLAMKMR